MQIDHIQDFGTNFKVGENCPFEIRFQIAKTLVNGEGSQLNSFWFSPNESNLYPLSIAVNQLSCDQIEFRLAVYIDNGYEPS